MILEYVIVFIIIAGAAAWGAYRICRMFSGDGCGCGKSACPRNDPQDKKDFPV